MIQKNKRIKRNLKKLILVLGITMLISDSFILLIGGCFTSFGVLSFIAIMLVCDILIEELSQTKSIHYHKKYIVNAPRK